MAENNESESSNETTESLKRENEQRKKKIELTEDQRKIIDDLIKQEKEFSKETTRRDILEMRYLDRIGKSNAAREAAMKLIKKVNREEAALTATRHDLADAQERLNETEDPEKRKEIQKEIKEHNKSIEQSTKLITDHAKEYKAANDMLKKHKEISAEDQESVNKLTGAFESMTMGLISATQAENNIITKTGMMIVELSEADDVTQVLTESFGAVFNVANIMASLFDTIVASTKKMAKEFDNASAAFSKTTGLAREYGNVLYDVQRQGNQFGVSAAEGGQAMAGLLANFSDFHKTAPAVQKDLSLNVAQLSKFGVSADESAKLMQNFNKIMGMSGKEAVETSKKIGMMGTKIGIATSKMLKDYTASLKTLAVYGDKSIKVFTGIAAAAKSAGVETGTLLAMVEKYDTFAGAAEGAGKLNAILGSQLSATEMLMMTEDERLKTMISTMQATGQSFGAMDKFTQKAIASAAGISDMAEANKIFGMSLSEYESYEMQMNQSAKTQERFEEALRSMTPLLDKLGLLANEFAAVFVPALEKATVVIEKLIGFMRWLDDWTNGWATTIMGGVAAMVLFYKTMTLMTGGIITKLALGVKERIQSALKKKDIAEETLLTKEQYRQEMMNQRMQRSKLKTQRMANKANQTSIKTMLALGAAILMIGGGIYLAATGMAEFVKSFGSLNSEQLAAAQYALLGFAVGIVALGVALGVLVYTGVGYAAIPILLSIGAAVLMIGLGVGIAAAGFGYMLESIGSVSVEHYAAFGSSMLNFGIGLGVAAAGLGVFMLSFGALMTMLMGLSGPWGWAALAVLAGVAASVYYMGLGAKMANDSLAALTTTISDTGQLGDIMKALYGSMDIASNAEAERRIKVVRELVDEISGADIKPELENLALITTGVSAGLMTENTVSQMLTVSSLADQIKNIFNADITVKIDGDAVKDLFEDGVYKTSMGNR
jgi:hypothetical protein